MQLSDIDAFFKEKQNEEILLPRAIRLNDMCKLVCSVQGQNSKAKIATHVTIEKQHSIVVFETDSYSQMVSFKVAGILSSASVPNFWFEIKFEKLAKLLKWKYPK